MTVGRNKPCTCGSGKKYKHCCLRRHRTEDRDTQARLEASSSGDKLTNVSDKPFVGNVIPTNPLLAVMSRSSSVRESGDDDDYDGLGSLFADMIFNLREWKLKKLPHIKEYRRLRKIYGEIELSMIKHLDSGKFEHKMDAAAGLAMSRELQRQERPDDDGTVNLRLTSISFDMNTYVGEQAYYDMHFYKIAPNANSITEEYIESRRFRKPEKIAFLDGMHNSVRGLFEIVEVDSDNAYVHLREVFTGKLFKIVDVGLSMRDTVVDMYIYRRIVTVGDISMGVGVSLAFKKSDRFIKEFIAREKACYHPFSEMLRFNDLYYQYTTVAGVVQQLV